MKKHSVGAITKKVREIWASADFYDAAMTMPKVNPTKFEVRVDKEEVEITISSMYSPPGLSFANLKELSDFFETTNINDDDRFHYPGCPTCDYGSEAGFTLTVRP